MNINPVVIDQSFVDAVEERIGMGRAAWDMVDPVKLCEAVLAEATHRFPPLLMVDIKPEEKEAFVKAWTRTPPSAPLILDSEPPFPPLP
jgi:hypothetical protein